MRLDDVYGVVGTWVGCMYRYMLAIIYLVICVRIYIYYILRPDKLSQMISNSLSKVEERIYYTKKRGGCLRSLLSGRVWEKEVGLWLAVGGTMVGACV